MARAGQAAAAKRILFWTSALALLLSSAALAQELEPRSGSGSPNESSSSQSTIGRGHLADADPWNSSGAATLPDESTALDQAPAPNPRLGLVHVDLMDLHAERDAGGGVRKRELMAPAALQRRFDRAVAAGVSADRWSLYWDLVETPAGFDWSVADEIVARDLAAGLVSLPILQGTPPHYATGGLLGILPPSPGGGPSAWLRAASADDWLAPRSPQASVPRGLNEPVFTYAGGSTGDAPAGANGINPANPWARFVAAAAERYRPGGALGRSRGWSPDRGVRTWEVGNEPNLAFFWSGSAADFARYLQVGYLALKWADPNAVVVHAGIADGEGAATWYQAFLASVKARAAAPGMAGANFFFDKAAWHWYAYPTLLNTGPAAAAALVAAAGLPPKPIWVTEMGVSVWDEHPGPCWDRFSSWRATTVEQAGYVWQALSEALAADVERAFLFQLFDDCGNGPTSYDAFGLNRNPADQQCWADPGQACWRLDPASAGSERPSQRALARWSGLLASAELLWRPAEEAGRWQRLLFYRPPGERVMLVWNRLLVTQTVEVQATGRSADLWVIRADGTQASSTITPTGGRFRLDLPPATNRNNPGNHSPIMAGLPLILVESDVYAPFRAEVKPLPAVSPTDFDVTISAADGGAGVGSVRLYVANRVPASTADWTSVGDARPWTALARGGELPIRFQGQAGNTYYFAATARDRAGNETTLPLAAQAQTSVESGPTPTPAPPTSTTRPTAAMTRTPAATPTRPDWQIVATIRLPAVHQSR